LAQCGSGGAGPHTQGLVTDQSTLVNDEGDAAAAAAAAAAGRKAAVAMAAAGPISPGQSRQQPLRLRAVGASPIKMCHVMRQVRHVTAIAGVPTVRPAAAGRDLWGMSLTAAAVLQQQRHPGAQAAHQQQVHLLLLLLHAL